MTVTANSSGQPQAAAPDLVTLTIDDAQVSVPKGTLIIRAAEQLGIAIPRFCDHPALAPAGACRQCLVEVATPGPDGTLRPMPKPQASCAMECSPGMVVRTQQTSPVAEKAQRGIMEFLLVNHPLDCPVCDKGGECPLQNQALANGRSESRFVDVKRTFAKPIRISTQVLLDRERCILCQRCTRFSEEIAGDPFIDLQMRGANQQIGTFSPEVLGFTTTGDAAITESGQPFASYFSGNTVQICPVGALTGAAYRFRARPFDLVSSAGVCEHCASGCALRVDHRRGTVTRRLALEDPAVNEDWNCDKGRWAFTWTTAPDRLEHPMVRDDETGELRVASWPEALDVAARGLAAAAANGGVGVLVGGRVTVEDAYAYGKFARVAMHTNDIDMRARPHSVEEAHFLAHAVAGRAMGPTYRELETAPAVLLLGFEPEEESPIVFLRLRKAATTRAGAKLAVFSVAPWASRGLTKLNGRLVMSAPGTETEVISAIAGAGQAAGAEVPQAVADAGQALRSLGAVILVGERLAAVPGALTAALDLAKATGARLAWVPRRAGERGAVEAGALPNLMPGGRPVNDPTARVDLAAAWGVDGLPTTVGRDTTGIVTAAARGELAGLVVGGVDPRDLPRPDLARKALDTVGFLVSLEVRSSEVTQRADVVLPVAPVTEKAGTFVNWEGRWRPFEPALPGNALADFRVLEMVADAMGVVLGLRSIEQVRSEIASLDTWDGLHAPSPMAPAGTPPAPAAGTAALATWALLLDAGRGQDGEAHLAGTAHRAVARMSAATAAEAGVSDGGDVIVSTDAGWITVPVVITEMPDRVVWLPTNSPGCTVRADLGADTGAVVSLRPVAATAGTGEQA